MLHVHAQFSSRALEMLSRKKTSLLWMPPLHISMSSGLPLVFDCLCATVSKLLKIIALRFLSCRQLLQLNNLFLL